MAKQETVEEIPVAKLSMDKLITAILTTRRCHNSKGELDFLKWIHGYIKGLSYIPKSMAEGCIAVEVGEKSKTLFSCHLDTVHSAEESNKGDQELIYDENFGHVFANEDSSCLGADDGGGIYLLLKMMEAKVPGTYLFHRGEEKGGVGAHAMLAKHETWLENFDRCIAFDRRGTSDVVLTQGGALCASTLLGKQLCGLLDVSGLKHAVSHAGTFTDCKVYKQIIPCCVNVAVGYQNEHHQNEYLDFGYLQALTKVCCTLPWETLKIERKIVPEPYVPRFANWQSKMDKDLYSDFDVDDNTAWAPYGKQAPKNKVFQAPVQCGLKLMSYDELVEWSEDPEEDVVDAIVRLLLELDVEKAKVARLQTLLGL